MAELLTSGTPEHRLHPAVRVPAKPCGRQRGVIKALRKSYPWANIVAVDYDPGASEVNQLNRIKLMLSSARRAMRQRCGAGRGSAADGPLSTGCSRKK